MAAEYEKKTKLLDYFSTKELSPLPHLHKELELIYVKKGSCTAIADKKSYHLSDGDLFLTFPYQVHYYLNSTPGEYYVHAFPTTVLASMESVINSNELQSNVFPITGDTPEGAYLQSIKEASGEYAIATRFAYLILIMALLLPKCKLIPLASSSGITVRNILAYCSNHYTEHISLDTLSEALHLNKYYISHCINGRINMRLNTFIASLRTEAACKLLQDTDRKISDIAQEVGFETIRSFNRAFGEIAGCTPKDYRNRYRK